MSPEEEPSTTTTPTVNASCLEVLIRLQEANLIEPDGDLTLCSSWPSSVVAFHSTDDTAAAVRLLNLGGQRRYYKLPSLPSLQGLTNLQTLNLGGTDLPLHELRQVLTDIAPSIQTLYLGANESLHNQDGMAVLGSWISTEPPHLRKIDLRYNDIGPAGIAALLSLQLGNEDDTPLRILHLEGNCLGDEGSAHLAAALSNNRINVTELYLGANGIGPAGATALAESLRTNTKLTKLYMEGNAIGPEGANAFTTVLESNTSNVLRHLFVDNNGIGKEESEALSRALNGESVIEDIASHYNSNPMRRTVNEEEKKE